MDKAAFIIFMMQTGRELMAAASQQAEISRNNGEISEETFQRIVREGQASDTRWRDRIDSIRHTLPPANPT